MLDNDGDLSIVQSSKNAAAGFFNYAKNFTFTAVGAVSSMQLGNYNGFTAVQTYTYDNLNRIKDAKEMNGSTQIWKQTFQYDRYGNRNFDTNGTNTTTIPSGCAVAVCNPQVDAATNKLVGYQFDNSGNTKVDASGRQFIYDGENKQVEVKDANNVSVGRYYYDGDGKRVKKISASETTVFVYNAGGQLVAEYSTQISQTPQVSYLTTDHLGSPRINTDQNGAVIARHDYQPFGEEIQRASYGADAVRKQFTSYERDNETELDFAQARMFSYGYGRFTSPDPLLSSGRIEDPQTWNRYPYVLNNPLEYIDPSGLYECKGNKTQCDQFETRLNEAKENLKKIEEKYGKDSKQYKKANDSINSYGAKDEKNGVFVAFDRKKSGANTTGTFANNGKGKLLSITVHFNAKALDDEGSQSLVGHEGNHVDYFQTVGNVKSRYDFEFRAHEVESFLSEVQYPNSSVYATSTGDKKKKIEPKEYDIWNSSWEGPDRETLRSNAINEWLVVPTSQGGYGLKPPPPPKPKQTRQRRKKG